MKYLIIIPLRILFTPIALSMMGITAALEVISRTPDWAFWARYHQGLSDMMIIRIDLAKLIH